MVLKMCDVLIKSRDWRSVINEKERKGQEEERIGVLVSRGGRGETKRHAQ